MKNLYQLFMVFFELIKLFYYQNLIDYLLDLINLIIISFFFENTGKEISNGDHNHCNITYIIIYHLYQINLK